MAHPLKTSTAIRDTILAKSHERFQVCMEPTAIPTFLCGFKDSGVPIVCVDVGVLLFSF